LQIVVRTVSEQVYNAVRDRILSGQIAPESPIRQDALSAALGVSKIPLREALTRLEQDGLVSSHPNRGYVVTPMTGAEADEVFALRLKLEPEATAIGATTANSQQRRIATEAFELLDAEAEKSESRMGVLNREFHLALIRPSGKFVTIQLIERLQLIAERYVRAHLEPQGRERRARAEHAGLLKAWLAGDAPAVQRKVEIHISGALEDLRTELESKAAAIHSRTTDKKTPRSAKSPTAGSR
jgi:DNA-binding GntR family transcriptional regulator